MTDPRRALAALRYDANRAIDGPFADVAEAVEGIVLSHARTGKDGRLVLDAMGAAMIRFELRRALVARRDGLVGAIAERIVAAEALAERQAREVAE